jgi:hypothetical protein
MTSLSVAEKCPYLNSQHVESLISIHGHSEFETDMRGTSHSALIIQLLRYEVLTEVKTNIDNKIILFSVENILEANMLASQE